MLRIHYPNLVRQVLPPLKRTLVRLAWFNALLCPLTQMYADFERWRALQRMLVNVNGRTMVLEGFLRFKYNCPQISISTTIDNMPGVGLLNEGENYILKMGLLYEEPHPEFPLLSEREGGEFDVDFIVFVPATVNVNDVIADIETYKPPFATYNLVADMYLIDRLGRRVTDKTGQHIIITNETGYI